MIYIVDMKEVSGKEGVKFRVQSELALFDVLQQHGKLSVSELSKRANLARTASYYGAKRLFDRGLFDFRAVPRLDKFSDVPQMLLGFSHLKKRAIQGFVTAAAEMESVRMLACGKESVVLFLMGHQQDHLHELSLSISRRFRRPPVLSLLSPEMVKLDLTIPGSVLQALYAHLPERRGATSDHCIGNKMPPQH